MPGIDNEIKRVTDKLQQLLKQYQHLQKENQKLKESLQKAAAENETRQQEAEQLQLQLNILKSAAGQMPDADKKAFEKKISQYIRDIDKCITLLSE